MNQKTCILLTIILGVSCASIPKHVKAVTDFNAEKYLGKWYEIARFDFVFEKNLNNTTAQYTLNSDGTIKVENSGYNYIEGKWQKAVGKARFRGSKTIAELEVSFFGPFYAGYNVIKLDAEYKYALIAGNDLSYLWILSREKIIPDAIKQQYLQEANRLGFKTENLLWVEQN